jgi:hypothetical protein
VPTTADVRGWLRDNGFDVSDRGQIPRELFAAYYEANPGSEDLANGNGHRQDSGDYPDGMSDADFPAAEAEVPDDTAESRPRDVRPKAKAKARSFTARFQRKPGRGRPKHPRVPVDEIISGGWRILARIARPVPPLQRTLRVQAPVAGLLLEDSIKGTVVDAVLQPLARMQQRGRAVAALAGPPVIVTAITVHMQQRAALDPPQPPNPVVMSALTEALRESLIIWLDVAGPKFEQALERERRFEEKYGADVDQFMNWLFSPPPANAEEQEAEDESIRRAQGIQTAA